MWEVAFGQQHPFHHRPNGVTSPSFPSHHGIKTKEVYLHSKARGLCFRTAGKPAKPREGAPFSTLSNSPSHRGSYYWSPGRATVDRLGRKEHFITHKPIMAAPPIPELFPILFPLSRSRLQHHCWSLSSGCFSTQSSKQETDKRHPCRQQLTGSRHSTSRHGSKTASGLSGRGRPRNRGHLPPLPQVMGTRFTVVVLGFQSKSKTPFPQPCSPGRPVLRKPALFGRPGRAL